jgi:hypothetical protein
VSVCKGDASAKRRNVLVPVGDVIPNIRNADGEADRFDNSLYFGRHFLKPRRSVLPTRNALSVQSPFGEGGDENCLISLTTWPNLNAMSIQPPSGVPPVLSCFSNRVLIASALALSCSVAAGSWSMAVTALSFR